MKKSITHYCLAFVCLVCSCFSCQVEEVLPEEDNFILLGSWKIGTIAGNASPEEYFVTEFHFEQDNLFSLVLGRDSIVKGSYVLSQTEDVKPLEYLTLYGGKHFSKSYLIEEKKSTRLGLLPSDAIEGGNIYYFVRK